MKCPGNEHLWIPAILLKRRVSGFWPTASMYIYTVITNKQKLNTPDTYIYIYIKHYNHSYNYIYIYTRIYVYNQQWHGVESLKHGILAKIYVTFRGYKWLAWLVDCWVNGLIPLCCRYLMLDVGYEPTNQLTNQKPTTWITDQANPSKARKEASKQATSRASQARPSDPNHTKYRNQATSQLLPLHWLTKWA